MATIEERIADQAIPALYSHSKETVLRLRVSEEGVLRWRAPPRGPRSLRCSGSGEVPWRRGVEDTRGQIQKANASDVIQDVPNRDLAMQEASCSEHQTFKQVENTDASEIGSLLRIPPEICSTWYHDELLTASLLRIRWNYDELLIASLLSSL